MLVLSLNGELEKNSSEVGWQKKAESRKKVEGRWTAAIERTQNGRKLQQKYPNIESSTESSTNKEDYREI